jgi:hypothetical protein
MTWSLCEPARRLRWTSLVLAVGCSRILGLMTGDAPCETDLDCSRGNVCVVHQCQRPVSSVTEDPGDDEPGRGGGGATTRGDVTTRGEGGAEAADVEGETGSEASSGNVGGKGEYGGGGGRESDEGAGGAVEPCAPYRCEAVATLKASNAGKDDAFGNAAALAGDTLVVAGWLEDSGGAGVDPAQNDEHSDASGAAYVFVRGDHAWTQEVFLKAPVNVSGMRFGTSLAIELPWLVVGASHADGGYVSVFERTTRWVAKAMLRGSNTEEGDEFGRFVAISGTTLVATAYWEDSSATGVDGDQLDNGMSKSGAAYVFELNQGAWQQTAYLKASNTGRGDIFGGALAFDGTTIAIGSRQEDSADRGVDGVGEDDDAPNSGAVYLFERHEGSWIQTAYLKSSNSDPHDEFGSYLAIDGDTLAVGARLEDSAATGVDGDQDDNSAKDSGAVYVFVRSGSGWVQQAYLKASNTGPGDRFGTRVALRGDLLAVGATGESYDGSGPDNDGAEDSGAVYLFKRTGTTWAQVDYFKAPSPRVGAEFGLDLVMDEKTLLVGAWKDSGFGPKSGAAYVFR